jgi:hypothetical protein
MNQDLGFTLMPSSGERHDIPELWLLDASLRPRLRILRGMVARQLCLLQTAMMMLPKHIRHVIIVRGESVELTEDVVVPIGQPRRCVVGRVEVRTHPTAKRNALACRLSNADPWFRS